MPFEPIVSLHACRGSTQSDGKDDSSVLLVGSVLSFLSAPTPVHTREK